MQKYSIDASAILDAWVRQYPIDTLPSFWNRFKALAESKEGIAIEEDLIVVTGEKATYNLAKPQNPGCLQ